MAEGSEAFRTNWEESEEIATLMSMAGFLNVQGLGLEKIADQHFQEKEYQMAASLYSMALKCPINNTPLEKAYNIAEEIYRKRNECWFELGSKFKEWNMPSRKATDNSMVESLFILISALERLGEYVQVLPFAVMCKHLRPKNQRPQGIFAHVKEKVNKMMRKDGKVVDKVLEILILCGKEEMEKGNFELALDYFSELLELVYFRFLPGVLLVKAKCLLRLGKHGEAKKSCEKVLVNDPNNEIAQGLIREIHDKLKNSNGTKQETPVRTVGKKKARGKKKTKSTKEFSSQEDIPLPEDSPEDEATRKHESKTKEKNEGAVEENFKVVPSTLETTGKTPQPKIETPSHDDVSGEERSQNTSSVEGTTRVGVENPNKTTSGKTAASISLSTSTVQASDVNGGDSSLDDFITVYSRRRRSGRAAKANTGNNSTLPGDDADQPLCNNALLKGVVVACDHFLRGNSLQSSKVCAACKQPGNSSCLRYVVLNRTSNNWQKLRSSPAFNVPSKAKWDLCRNFNQGKRCAKKPCPFPHGEVESAMWTMEHNGGKLF
ncbi:PREDICTED: uncharacterized protein LOC107329436 isoform X2 [Acropora digitifera]|nr:PREDICTED: uncharacterized protein LOC107329436 isoform X2 [Acropora digitifera]XP_015749612.1 PREDICTED: uncharacterized protein LOC107329436 isoform X2 [Acropora digitifera]